MGEAARPAWEPEPERELEDAADRTRILTELDRNLVVEAAAGAGKTHALVGRIVALLAEDRCTIDEVAAVTFTRKAAGELRGRLLTRIEASLRRLEQAGEPEAPEATRLREALDGFERGFAGTIHAFCARLLRERPVEAGVDPGFEEVDPREEASLRREAWDRHLDRESEGPSRRLARLEALGIDPEELYAAFGKLCDYPEVETPREERPAPDLEGAVERVRSFVAWALERIPRPPHEDSYDALQGKVFAAASFLRNRDLEDDADRAAFLAIFDGGTDVTQKLWEDKSVGKAAKERFAELEEGTIAPALRAWREHCYPAVLDFLEPAVERYERLRRARGVLNFQDLLLRTAELLRRNPAVRSHFAQRYPRLLVDEFQDTDPLQAEILFLLTGEEGVASDWRRMTPRPGSLFLVGDPKQSIYRFRRADVDVYRFVRDRIEATGGEVVTLRTSFRSLAPLVGWLNESLRPVLEAHDADVQPPFAPLAPHRGPDGDGPRVRQLCHEKIKGNRKTEVAVRDARRIARWVRAALDGDAGGMLDGEAPTPGDVLVLLRQKKHLDVYARALEEAGLPYEVSGGDAVADSEELATLLAMAEAALHPDDSVALVAHLRGPLVGLSDDALYRFREAGGVWDYGAYARRGRPLHGIEEAEAFEAAFEQLARTYGWLHELPPAAALERLMESTGVLAHAAGLEAGSSRAGSLYRVLSLVREWQAAGREVAWVLEELRALAEGEGQELEEMVLEAGRGEAVRVMNLHKAKGLEGRVVFLADPLTKHGGWVGSHVERIGDGEPRGHFRVTRPNPYGGAPNRDLALPPGWGELSSLEARYQAAEEARLLYVAATRARDLLVVSRYPHPDRGPWTELYPALEEVPELRMPSNAAGGVRSEAGRVVPPDPAALEARRQALRAPSYAISQPSDLDEAEPVAVGAGAATARDAALAFGRVVHELLRDAVEGAAPPDEEAVGRLLEDEGGDAGEADAALADLGRARGAWFWSELADAERLLCEVPFGRLLGGKERTTLERGVVDLAYRHPGRGWVLVDWKTHRTADDAALDALAEGLAPQVEAYREAWEAIVGEPVARAGFLFTRTGAWREVG